MKKLLSVLMVLAVLPLFADLIFWQVSDMGTSAATSFDYAQFVQITHGTDGAATPLAIADANGQSTGYTMAFSDAATGTSTGGGVWAFANDIDESDTFRLELYDAAGNNIAWTLEATYADLAPFIKASATDRVALPWTPSVVPEPSTGLLLLLGLALVGLVRPQVKL